MFILLTQILQRNEFKYYLILIAKTKCNILQLKIKYIRRFLLRTTFKHITHLKKESSNTGEYQPDELDDNMIENNHEECSYRKKSQFIILGEKMRCQKVKRIFRYNMPN